ncbi:hypothetical protein SGODD07_00943 [Streptococcus gordonii]|jgi:hypothetical protein|uniref:Phage protein n=2 Tax=Streptococcus TaxID=1301 RepID=A0A139N7Y7_STRGN|nr:DUF6731 family protein [Streptococcus sanguinis]KXT71894.1 hypothetical protein SGODD07_00943 [Streptococcus gordonii]EFX94108.1 hypothetical protein HMPREF9398_0877 [Streptococcus sanguinis VMC66]MBZ2022477.1 hypothetical protein [Streptococcus sanguinis]MBZ2047176.1 hypothetical protein [Streptococcus sanguinis]MBZ2050128.1 hypothetical protein [Streptococcus sanguinis]
MVVEREFKCLFYKVVSKENAVSKINAFFAEINPMTPLSTESIGNLSYYLRSDIRKTDTYLLFTIAKVDLNQDIQIDDIQTQNRDIVEKEDTEGIANDAQFLYDFNNSILVQKRGKSQTTIEELRKFIALKVGIDYREFEFNIIKDKNAIENLNNMRHIHDVVFSIAIPENLSLFSEQVKDINSGVEFAKEMSAQSMEMRIKGASLNKNRIKRAIDELCSYKDNQNMKIRTMSVYGDSEIIDLVTHKLNYYEKYYLDEVDNNVFYDKLERAYKVREEYLNDY